MNAYLRRFRNRLADTFWLVPGAVTVVGVLLAVAMVRLDRSGLVAASLLASPWIYDGGGTGARTLLGAVASSTIGVAGTVFSITIAALSFAAGQMGPRLLRNFTRDRGVQVTLGVFLGTFSYVLMVLRSVRSQEEGAFVPHVALSVAIVLALVSVATLIYFVGHMAQRINVDTVVELVAGDLRAAYLRLTVDTAPPASPPPPAVDGWAPIADDRSGYLQELDSEALADWADRHDTSVRLLVRAGDYVFPGAPIALVRDPVDGVGDAIVRTTALDATRAGSADLEFAVRQLVEVAVRALSPGINDPHTAISVLDHLGATLCEIASRRLPDGVHVRRGRVVLVLPSIDYDGLVDSMFHMIRQNAAGGVAVRARLVEVLTAVATCERDEARRRTLARHAALVIDDATRDVGNAADLADLRQRHAAFERACAA